MKKIAICVLAFGLLISCNNNTKETTTPTEEVKKGSYSIKENTTILKWTAYKTTAKKGVGGEFTEVNLKNIPEADSPQKVLDGLSFSIPVSSLFTKDETRDGKLKKFFFGMMANTELISGEYKNIEGDDKKGLGLISLNMNDVTCDLPFEYTIEGSEINITSTLNIRNWKADDALASLNKACEKLHSGEDGVSKTWEDVSINASIEFKEN